MRRILPEKRSNKWLFVPVLVSLVMTALIAVMASFLLSYSSFSYGRLIIFNLIVGLVIALAGWLGARMVVWFTSAGLLVGLAIMFSIWTENTGWENLVGVFVLASCLGIGFLLGLVVELAVWIVRRRVQNSHKS